MKLWLTSDTHFSHANVIGYCSRPFTDVDAMNETMVKVWNSRVGPDDIVLHMGDLAMGQEVSYGPVITALSGRKVLLRGNHDGNKVIRLLRSLGWIVGTSLVVQDALFRHHYLRSDEDFKDITKVVHGHAHGSHEQPRHVDVGVDALGKLWNYGPIPAGEVLCPKDEFVLALALKSLFAHRKQI